MDYESTASPSLNQWLKRLLVRNAKIMDEKPRGLVPRGFGVLTMGVSFYPGVVVVGIGELGFVAGAVDVAGDAGGTVSGELAGF
jgi:hypothetical protein